MVTEVVVEMGTIILYSPFYYYTISSTFVDSLHFSKQNFKKN